MPVLDNFEVEVSDIVVNLVEFLFKKYDLNEGQRSIANSANIDADVRINIDVNYEGTFIYLESSVSSYNLVIDLSHPEALDECLSEIYDTVEQFVYEAWDYTKVNPIAYTTEQALSNVKSFSAPFKYASADVGLFDL